MASASDTTRILTERTIEDFGEQWSHFTTNEGYYVSRELFADIVGPLLPAEAIRGARVIDIGSGTGRIVRMLLACQAGHVNAVEPSSSFEVMAQAVEAGIIPRNQVSLLRMRGDEVPAGIQADLATSIGVLHHIPDPAPVMRAVHAALRPGGSFVAWLYGREGNLAYLTLVRPLSVLTTRLPHRILVGLSHVLHALLCLYGLACRVLPLPLRRYLSEVFFLHSRTQRVMIIYDQLNPAYAKYYRRQEAIDLFTQAGFVHVAVHHRHGYSWAVIGHKAGI